jgi:subtilisin family serine protease
MARYRFVLAHRPHTALLLAALLLALGAWPGAGLAQDLGPDSLPSQVVAKVDEAVLAAIAEDGSASFIALMAEQADLSRAYQLRSKEEKGRFVFEALRIAAERSQAGLLAELKARSVAHRSLYVVNAVVVEQGDLTLAAELAGRADVARLVANPTVRQSLPMVEAAAPDLAPEAIERGVNNVNAPQVWATYGITGTGIIIAGQDTGIRWTHNALKSQYRGWDGASADHNYNWWDAIHADLGAANPCGINLAVPCDDNGHGTHTIGTVVGDDGGSNQIGVAPGAQWIGCRNMESGIGTPTTYAECFQFFLAPTDLAGMNPNPALAPHVINNSWGCPGSEGCTPDTWYVIQAVQQSLRAAGVLVVASAGNDGSSCGSINTPLAIFPESFAVGAHSVDTNNNTAMASFSSRGPRYYTNLQGPDVSAPGVSVRSATRANDTAYGSSSGTSMAGPHAVGVAALLWSAVPELVGQVPATEQYLRETAAKNLVGASCGGGANAAPWNTWDNAAGYGRVDALAAVQAALCPADINYDDVIDVVDISLLASQWNLSLGDSGYNPRRDLDFDHTISVNDLVAVASQWQTSCSGS